MTLIFSSVTYAIKAQKLLARYRIYTTLTRSPSVTAVRGCGYGLKMSDVTREVEALSLLSGSGISVLGTTRE